MYDVDGVEFVFGEIDEITKKDKLTEINEITKDKLSRQTRDEGQNAVALSWPASAGKSLY